MAQVTYRGVNYDTEEYNKKVLEEATKRQRYISQFKYGKKREELTLLSWIF